MKKFLILIAVLLAMTPAYAGSLYKTATITAENTFSQSLNIGNYGGAVLTLSGSWAGTVTLQRKSGPSPVWSDVTDNNGATITFTQNGTYTIYEATQSGDYRFGVKTGDFTSGSIVGVLEYY